MSGLINKSLISALIFLVSGLCEGAEVEIEKETGIATETKTETNQVPALMAFGVSVTEYQGASVADSDTELSITTSSLKLPLGRFSVSSWSLAPQLQFDKTEFTLEGQVEQRETMYSIKAPIALLSPKHNGWQKVLSIMPSWHTDLDATDGDAFSMMGLFMWRYDNTGPHSYAIGGGFNRLFGEYKAIPMLSYSYQSSPFWRLTLGFPVTKIESRFADEWSVYGSIAPNGGNWRYQDAQQASNNLAFESWNAALGLRRKVFKSVWLSLETGNSFARKFDLNENSPNASEVDLEDASFIRLSIGYHPM